MGDANEIVIGLNVHAGLWLRPIEAVDVQKDAMFWHLEDVS